MVKNWKNDKQRKLFKRKLDNLIPHGKAKQVAQQIGVSEDSLSTWRKIHKAGIPTIVDAIKLADALGVSLAELAGIENKDEAIHHPRIKELVEIAAYIPQPELSVIIDIIRTCSALTQLQLESIRNMIDALHTTDTAHEPTPTYTPSTKTIEVPHYTGIAAGPPIDMNDSVSTTQVPADLITDNPKQYYTLKVTGNSMTECGITDGSTILVRNAQGEQPHNGGIYIMRLGTKATVKKLIMELTRNGTPAYYQAWCDGTGKRQQIKNNDWAILGEYVGTVD